MFELGGRHARVVARTALENPKVSVVTSLFMSVAGTRTEIILVQDAELEYDPIDDPKLLEPILDGRADVVYGSRFLSGPPTCPLLLALCRKQDAHFAFERGYQP